VLQELTGRGLRVPDDVAIVGYDDIEFAGAAAVPLSSVRQPREQLGERRPNWQPPNSATARTLKPRRPRRPTRPRHPIPA
jgi:hypothetical protein